MTQTLLASGVLDRIMDSSWFLVIAGFCTLILLLSMAFGHDHDADHDHDMDHDHDHDHSHDSGHSATGNMSVFSIKVIMACGVGFGVAGYIAARHGCSMLVSSLWGVAGGITVGSLAYLFLNTLYRSQYSGTVTTREVIGLVGTVETSISPNGVGRICCVLPSGRISYIARTRNGMGLARDAPVKIVDHAGSILIVEPQN